MRTLTIALLLFAAIPVNIYPFVYLTRPWRSTPAGRALMVKAWGNWILVNMSVAAWLLPDYPGREYLRNLGLATFAAGVWYLLIVLLKTPRFPQKPKPDPTERRSTSA